MSLQTTEDAIAAAILSAWDAGASLDPEVVTPPASLEAGLARQEAVNTLRRARGEKPVGYKIGFTNRSIWPLYKVFHPIWAPVWNTTLTQLDATRTEIGLQHFAEPRLEPEIVLCLAHTPQGSGADAIFEAIDWIAHGLEIVQSPYPGWKFSAAEAVAAQSLHGALVVGPRKPRGIVARWQDLAELQLTLALDGQPIQRQRRAGPWQSGARARTPCRRTRPPGSVLASRRHHHHRHTDRCAAADTRAMLGHQHRRLRTRRA